MFKKKKKISISEEQLDLKYIIEDPSRISEFDNPSEELQLKALEVSNFSPDIYLKINNPTDYIIEMFVSADVTNIRFVKNQSMSLQVNTITHAYPDIVANRLYMIDELEDNLEILKYFINPSEDVILYAIRKSAKNYLHVKNKSIDFNIKAIGENWKVIKYIKNPSEDEQLTAIMKNTKALEFIENPTNNVIKALLKIKDNNINFYNYNNINNIDDPETISLILSKNPEYLFSLKDKICMDKQSDDFIYNSLKISPESIMYIEKPNWDHVRFAIKYGLRKDIIGRLNLDFTNIPKDLQVILKLID